MMEEASPRAIAHFFSLGKESLFNAKHAKCQPSPDHVSSIVPGGEDVVPLGANHWDMVLLVARYDDDKAEW